MELRRIAAELCNIQNKMDDLIERLAEVEGQGPDIPDYRKNLIDNLIALKREKDKLYEAV